MDTQSIKIWKKTLPKLRMLHALMGKSMSQIIEDLVAEKLEKERKNEKIGPTK